MPPTTFYGNQKQLFIVGSYKMSSQVIWEWIKTDRTFGHMSLGQNSNYFHTIGDDHQLSTQ